MKSSTILKGINTIDTFQIKGEEFVVLKKDYVEELILLMKSFDLGQKMLQNRKTRSFVEFLESAKQKKG